MWCHADKSSHQCETPHHTSTVTLRHTLQTRPGTTSDAVYVLQPHPTDAHILASAGYDGYVRGCATKYPFPPFSHLFS